MMRPFMTLALIVAPMAAPVAARRPGDIAEVREGLIAVAVGDMIQKNCGAISPRLVRVYTLRTQLIAAAREAGFTNAEIDAFVDNASNAEIDAFVDNATVRAELEGVARQYLEERGVEPAEPKSYCDVGNLEIAQQTDVGRLLRNR